MAGLKKKMTGFGLAKKLAVSITIFLLILSVTLTIINVRTQETSVRQRLLDTANGTVSLLKESATDPMILLQIHKLRLLLADVLKQEEVIYAYAFDNEGRILTDGTKANPFRDKILDNVISKRGAITETVSSQHKADILDITRSIYLSDKMLGGVRVGFTLKRIKGEIINVRNRNIYLGAIFVLIGICFTFILARAITKPIYNLQKGIEKIGEGDLDYKVGTNAKDEIGDLSRAFDRMTENLNRATTSRKYLLQEINERKRAEEDLRKLSRAVEQSSTSVVITDKKGDIEYVNPKFTRITGYTLEEVVGKNPRVLKTDETSSEEYRELWETITSGNEWEGEFHNKKKNGQLYWEHTHISPVKNKDGGITHFLAIKEDITERKRIEEELRVYIRQQKTVTNLGQKALLGGDLTLLMGEAVRSVAATLDVEYCKILKLLPDGKNMLLLAGEGWKKGLVGSATVQAGLDSQAGYTLNSNKPVIVKDLKTETRFSGPPLLHEHNVVSGNECDHSGAKRSRGGC